MSALIRLARPDEDWSAIHRLLTAAFASMEGRIDPPSSLGRMSPADLARAATPGILAEANREIVGCCFARPEGDALYLGKIAVAAAHRRRGLAGRLIDRARTEARRRGLAALMLQTRVELIENQAAFAALGFTETGRTAHPGYDRPTSVTMRAGFA